MYRVVSAPRAAHQSSKSSFEICLPGAGMLFPREKSQEGGLSD